MTPHPEAHYKDDTFHCQKLTFTGHWRQCLVNQAMALKVKNATNTKCFYTAVGYDRLYSCLDCEQGKTIRKAHPFIVLTRKIKPPPKKTVEKPQPKRQKVRTNQEVNFKRIMEKWNRAHGKRWTSIREWMSWMYHVRHYHTLKYFAEEIGVNAWSLRRKLVLLGVYNEAFRLYPALEDKPMCSQCGKYHAWCKGLCQACYQAQYREMKKRREAGE